MRSRCRRELDGPKTQAQSPPCSPCRERTRLRGPLIHSLARRGCPNLLYTPPSLTVSRGMRPRVTTRMSPLAMPGPLSESSPVLPSHAAPVVVADAPFAPAAGPDRLPATTAATLADHRPPSAANHLWKPRSACSPSRSTPARGTAEAAAAMSRKACSAVATAPRADARGREAGTIADCAHARPAEGKGTQCPDGE
jgi:hypothetical protein